ncbi:hypothetical protein D3C86_1861120 [compost metagenome]
MIFLRFLYAMHGKPEWWTINLRALKGSITAGPMIGGGSWAYRGHVRERAAKSSGFDVKPPFFHHRLSCGDIPPIAADFDV